METDENLPDGRITTAWVENYHVEARKLIIQYVDNNKTKGMSNFLHYNLSF